MFFKRQIKSALLASGALRAWNALRPAGVIVLRYHCIQPKFDQSNQFLRGIVHLEGDFEDQMAIIARQFNPVSLEDIYQAQVRGTLLPRRSVCVTFDDGFRDNLEIAAPIMEKYGVVGTIYVTTGLLKREVNPWFVRVRRAFFITTESTYPGMEGVPYDLTDPGGRWSAFLEASRLCATSTGEYQLDIVQQVEDLLSVIPMDKYMMMTETQVRQTVECGHIIGSHTVNHPNVAHIPEDILEHELVKSKAVLDGLTGRSCHHFSYPRPILSPHYTDATGEAIRRAGYVTGVTCTLGVVRSGDDLMSIKRMSAPFGALEFEIGMEKLFSGIWKEA